MATLYGMMDPDEKDAKGIPLTCRLSLQHNVFPLSPGHVDSFLPKFQRPPLSGRCSSLALTRGWSCLSCTQPPQVFDKTLSALRNTFFNRTKLRRNPPSDWQPPAHRHPQGGHACWLEGWWELHGGSWCEAGRYCWSLPQGGQGAFCPSVMRDKTYLKVCETCALCDVMLQRAFLTFETESHPGARGAFRQGLPEDNPSTRVKKNNDLIRLQDHNQDQRKKHFLILESYLLQMTFNCAHK